MARELRVTRLHLIALASFIFSFSSEAVNYNIVLTDIKCTYNKNYASSSSCQLSEPAPASGANFELKMKKEVKMFRIDLNFFLERGKKFISLFKAPDLDVCVEFHKKQTALYLECFKEMTKRAGKWPKCPIEADFHYKFVNITPNTQFLPSFLPPVAFKLTVTMKNKTEIIMNTAIMGRVVQKQSLKGKQKH